MNRYFEVSTMSVSDMYRMSTLAWHLLMRIGQIDTVSDFKIPKTYMLESCSLSESDINYLFAPFPHSKVVGITF